MLAAMTTIPLRRCEACGCLCSSLYAIRFPFDLQYLPLP
jgi:hypothetical protein